MTKLIFIIIKIICGILAAVFGFLGMVLVFIIALPLVAVGKFIKFLKRSYENTRRLFNCTINGYWIYF